MSGFPRGGSGGGGSGTVTSVTAGNASVIQSGVSTVNPSFTTGTLDAIATAEKPVAAVNLNAQKIINLANGTAATDGAAFGQLGSTSYTEVTKTTTYAILTTDVVVFTNAAAGGFTVTLPTAVGAAGKYYIIKKQDSTENVVTVATTSSQTIDGTGQWLISTPYQSITVLSDGSNWNQI